VVSDHLRHLWFLFSFHLLEGWARNSVSIRGGTCIMLRSTTIAAPVTRHASSLAR